MIRFSLIRPLDQPPATRRLLQDLKAILQDGRFNDFRIVVAYAKSGPLYRLQDLLTEWKAKGNTSAAIFGLDQQGTSKDALELALSLFNEVYVTQEAGITFHPKIYFFKGQHHAQAFIGSNNLTVGGTEKNFEAAVHLELDLPEDNSELSVLESAWDDLLPTSCPATIPLDAEYLAHLEDNNIILKEKAMRANTSDTASVGRNKTGPRSNLIIKPESPLPKKVLVSGNISSSKKKSSQVATSNTTVTPTTIGSSLPLPTARGFAIQIKPHNNGEIFLSVTAALQNPDFFDWPFNGMTTPKKPGNPSYPQLDPDPVVNIAVFGAGSEPALTLSKYQLNTVYYEKNSEIRITASPLVGVVPDYSVMIMERSDIPGIRYEITIHTPDSPEYEAWISACNQTMPIRLLRTVCEPFKERDTAGL